VTVSKVEDLGYLPMLATESADLLDEVYPWQQGFREYHQSRKMPLFPSLTGSSGPSRVFSMEYLTERVHAEEMIFLGPARMSSEADVDLAVFSTERINKKQESPTTDGE